MEELYIRIANEADRTAVAIALIKNGYIVSLCNEIMAIRKQEGLTNKYNFRTGEDYFNFWLNNKLPDQEYDLFKI